MIKKLFFILMVLACFSQVWAYEIRILDDNTYIYTDTESYLVYRLYPDRKEASLGTGFTGEYDVYTAMKYIDMDDPMWGKNPWVSVVVPETIEYNGDTYTVTSVAPKAFWTGHKLLAITLPETIRSIGFSAFGATNISTIEIPEGVTNIPEYAFYSCQDLKTIQLPSTVQSVGAEAFFTCLSLESISIPGNCAYLGKNSFSGCESLTSLVFEDSEEPISVDCSDSFGNNWWPYKEPDYYVKETWKGLFNDCPLKDIYIGRDIENFQKGTFFEFSPFEKIRQEEYDDGKVSTFHDGKRLDKVTFGDKVKKINKNLFNKARIAQGIVLPNNVEVIGESAFSEATTQPVLVIPASCRTIEKNAFQAFNTGGPFKTIKCQSAVPPTIVSGAFGGCFGFLVDVPRGSGSTYKNDEFWGNYIICDEDDQLVTVNVKYAGSLYGRLAFEDLAPKDVSRLKVQGTLGSDDWETINSMSNLYELDLSEVTAENLTPISDILKQLRYLKFPRGLKVIKTSQFQNSHLSGKIVFPETCTNIEAYAFMNSCISEVVIEGPTNIGYNAFLGCIELSKVSLLGDGIIASGESFHGIYDSYNPNYKGLETLILGNGVILETASFESCQNLKEVIIDGKAKSIAPYAFQGCVSLSKITFNGSVENISSQSFTNKYKVWNPIPGAYYDYSVNNIQELRINNIADWCSMEFSESASNPMAYAEKVLINGQEEIEITIPDEVTNIGNFAFYKCSPLLSISLPNDVKSIGNGAFSYCFKLKDLNLPESIETIGDSAFVDCSSLVSIVLPKQISKIGNRSFERCSSLSQIEFPQELQVIGDSAFAECISLENPIFLKNIKKIGSHAFENCETITSVELPFALTEIGESAFEGCSKLKDIEALWVNPLVITPNVFSRINSKCILWVPVGSVPNYYETGWGRIPLIDEGFCVINSHTPFGTHLVINGKTFELEDCTKVEIGEDADLQIVTPVNCYVSGVVLDGEDVLESLHNDALTINKIFENKEIFVSTKTFVLGDVNDDDYIDVGDITAIVKFIQQTPDESYIAKAADVNVDGDIDVGDITGTVNLIYENSNMARSRTISLDDNSGEPGCYLSAKIEESSPASYLVVSVNLDNTSSVYGLQFELSLPKGFSIPVDNEGFYAVENNRERVGRMNITSITTLPNGNYLFLYSSTNKSGIGGNSGTIVNIPIIPDVVSDLGSSAIVIRNIKMSDTLAAVVRQDEDIVLLYNENISAISNLIVDPLVSDGKYMKEGHLFIIKNGKLYSIDGIK